jgi:hypothetical protein
VHWPASKWTTFDPSVLEGVIDPLYGDGSKPEISWLSGNPFVKALLDGKYPDEERLAVRNRLTTFSSLSNPISASFAKPRHGVWKRTKQLVRNIRQGSSLPSLAYVNESIRHVLDVGEHYTITGMQNYTRGFPPNYDMNLSMERRFDLRSQLADLDEATAEGDWVEAIK